MQPDRCPQVSDTHAVGPDSVASIDSTVRAARRPAVGTPPHARHTMGMASMVREKPAHDVWRHESDSRMPGNSDWITVRADIIFKGKA